MKTKKLTIAIAIVAMTFIGTSCGNKQQKSASEATTEQLSLIHISEPTRPY